MKKLFIILIILFAFTGMHAQPGPPDTEKIEALRVAFLTKYLNLTPGEAQKFWPVYNQMHDEIKTVTDTDMKMMKEKPLEEMNDAALNNLITGHLDNEQKILDIKKKYAEEFKKVLPLRKVALLADAENEFKRELLKYAKDKNGGQPPPGADK